jgi:hypothetical protein
MTVLENMTVSEALEIQRQIEEYAKVAYDLAVRECQHKHEIQQIPLEVFSEVFSLGFFMAAKMIDIAAKNDLTKKG